MKKKLLSLLAIFTSALLLAQNDNVGINTTNPKSTFHINAITNGATKAEGIIIPSLTGDQIKAMPVTADQNGMMIYATSAATAPTGASRNLTSPGFYFWNNTSTVWEKLNANAASNSWSVSGNSGTTAGTNFIGTLDNQDLQFKRNNTLVGKLTANNISFGQAALSPTTTGGYNNALGQYSLYSNTSGGYNNALGFYSLYQNTSGSYNNALGYQSL